MNFIFSEFFLAQSRFGQINATGQIFRLKFVNRAEQGRGKSINRIDLLAVFGRKRRQGVKSLNGLDAMAVDDAVFATEPNMAVLHQAFVAQRANQRRGTHSTKTRGEVQGSTRKIRPQKYTGRARQGSTRASQWKGGGKAHAPHYRDYTMAMPRQMRRGALRSALSAKANEGQVVVVDEMKLDGSKTSAMANILNALGAGRSALVLLPESNEAVQKSVRNMVGAKTLHARYLNVRDLLGYDTLVLPLAALDVIKSYLGLEGAK